MRFLLSEKYNIKDFVIVLFTNDKNPISMNIPNCYEIIVLDVVFFDDIWRSTEYRINLYKEMWEKFCTVMAKYGYEYKSFEEQFGLNRMPTLTNNVVSEFK
jgi:hypothetical protein